MLKLIRASGTKGERMKKRILVVAFAVLAGLFSGQALFAQDLTQLGGDFTKLMGALGDQLEPNLRNAAVFGMGMGQAEIGNFPKISLSLTTGAVISSTGLLAFTGAPSYNVLQVDQLITSVIPGRISGSSIYKFLQGTVPYPITRISAAFGTVSGIEGLVQFSIWPQALTDLITGIADPSGGLAVTLNSLNIGGEVRKVLVPDAGGLPAISIGAKYVYSGFNVGYDLGTIQQNVSGSAIDVSGTINVQNSIHSIGAGLMVSKRLSVLTLYSGLTAWDQIVSYSGGVSNFKAVLGGSTYTQQPLATINETVLSTIATGGLELRFGGFVMFAHGQFDIAQLLASATVGLRFHF